MDKCIKFQAFMRHLIDDEKLVKPEAEVMKGMLEAQSLRLTNIAEKMTDQSECSYKLMHRFSKNVELKAQRQKRALWAP